MQDRLDLHSLPFLVVALLIFFIPLVVFLKNKKSALNRTFFILASASALWQVSFFFALNNEDPFIIMWWFRLSYVGIAFITPATFHFVSTLLGIKKIRPVLAAYLFAAFCSFLILRTELVISGIRKFYWGPCPVAGPLHNIFLAIWFVPFLVSLAYLFREHRSSASPYNKTRIRYFLVSLPIVYLGAVDFLPIYGFNVYPWGSFPVLFFCLLTVYSILRYRVLDIEIIIKKATLAALGIAVSISALYFGSFFLQPYFHILGGKNWV